MWLVSALTGYAIPRTSTIGIQGCILFPNPLCTMTKLLEVALLPILLLAVLALILWDVARGKRLECQ